MKMKTSILLLNYKCDLFVSFQAAGGVKETAFKSLDDLIGHYKRRNQGLAMHLRHPVQRHLAILKEPVKQAASRRPQRLRQPQLPVHESESQFPSSLRHIFHLCVDLFLFSRRP